ncbi:Lrp/AsnC ligand binding domain-containing protein [Maribacter confluentis]|uniref:Lrp/AsnC family transcriptional regulator, regulator for asnA, asnC and gidA n=2 Tax=Maribacter TaxID=252356 RepID=A0ABY1SDM4_9FLAO|nr:MULTISPECIES: Lrp/AsnC ligand binding domain-containing protein [Maribacter]MDO1513358.1 Lrp/AsnC ligand binding domain-containing protein [Maribacter confluentis]TVZ16605.1 Lrp/AsnC family transcriptional regulator for asnA, asnC and gidA [Maribacter sp. MAR_2009_72]SNR27932.1 Lrp/AsnC family transcriptional regulator, regulator for asnA, asnC and gidA [Maribacter sedimenticola]
MRNKLDQVDFNILNILADNAQTAYTDVAKQLTISPGTVHMRMRKMRDMGLITGATLTLDYAKMGWKMTIFLGIFLSEISLFKSVMKKLNDIEEVVKIHHVTGKYDIFIKMHARDSNHYKQVYQDEILSVAGIRGIESFISIEEKVERHIQFIELPS